MKSRKSNRICKEAKESIKRSESSIKKGTRKYKETSR